MREIFQELAKNPLGNTLKRALEAVAGDQKKALPLYDMQDQIIHRIRSRQEKYTLSDEALGVLAAYQSESHEISLARSHSHYDPALPSDHKPSTGYTINDLSG